jgi:hypothetical protein
VGLAGFLNVFLLITADSLSPQDDAPHNTINTLLDNLVLYFQGFLMLAICVAFGWWLHLGFERSVNLPVAYLGCFLPFMAPGRVTPICQGGEEGPGTRNFSLFDPSR